MMRLSAAFAALVLAGATAGCATSTHHTSSGAGHTSPSAGSHQTSAASGGGSLSAAQAIAAATRNTTHVSSLALTMSVTLHGLPAVSGIGSVGAPAGGAARLIMHEQMRLRPSLLASVNMHMTIGGHALVIDEILTSKALYVRAPGLLPTGAKPWTKVSLASLPNGTSLRTLFGQAQSSNPFSQLGSPQALARLLKVAQRVRVVGHPVVDGVSTTEYSGVISLQRIFALMPAANRRLLGSAPAGLRTPGPFRFWIDAKHEMRRMELQLHFRKISMAVRVDVTSINQPVSIVPPPASQVSTSAG
jgi:hypothetical protein